MSKQIRLQIANFIVVLSLILLAILGLRVPVAQTQTATVATAAEARKAAVVEATAEVLKETSELRQLPILRPVKSGTQSREEIQRFLIKNMDEDTTPAEMHASEVALKKLGLIPADFQFRPFIIRLLTEQVAGYYNPKQHEFFLADWIDLDGQKPVMAHELTHALQDQHYNLARFEKWPKGDSDAELAAHALIEGDASMAMGLYVTRNPGRIIALMKSMGANKSSTEEIEKAPRAIRESLLFPYEQGMQWVSQLFRREGWPLVSKAYTDLPQSTEQILHAEKYFAREAPIKVSLPDVASALGSGWKRIDYDVNGEWSHYLMLDQFLKEPQASKAGAAGWGGDRYAVYEEPKTGAVCIIQLSMWDTTQDATEFFAAYKKRTQLRYANATPIASPYPKTPTKSTEGQAWRTDEGLVFLMRNADRVIIVEGFPPNASIKKLEGLFVTTDTSK